MNVNADGWTNASDVLCGGGDINIYRSLPHYDPAPILKLGTQYVPVVLSSDESVVGAATCLIAP